MPSITGNRLISSKMTRFVYVDETGTNIKRDPFTIVGGIIVHADNQMKALEGGLVKICRELVPEDLWQGENLVKPFYFHASDYMNGFGPYKDLKKAGLWPVEKGNGGCRSYRRAL